MNGPLSFDDVRALKQQGDLARFLKQAIAVGRAECARRRGLVLAYPDLAKKLTEYPVSHTAPEQWTGYIPPATFNGGPNPAPTRNALLALVTEAERRTTQPRGAAA
jgi:hypothetical protein